MIQLDINGIYTPVNIQKAIENCHLEWIFPLNMVIFHSDVNVYQRVIPDPTITPPNETTVI